MKIDFFKVRGDIVAICENCENPHGEHEDVGHKEGPRCPGGTTHFQKAATKRRLFTTLDGREREVEMKRVQKYITLSPMFGWGSDVKLKAAQQSAHGALLEAVGPNEADEHFEALANVLYEASDSGYPFSLVLHYDKWAKKHDGRFVEWEENGP